LGAPHPSCQHLAWANSGKVYTYCQALQEPHRQRWLARDQMLPPNVARGWTAPAGRQAGRTAGTPRWGTGREQAVGFLRRRGSHLSPFASLSLVTSRRFECWVLLHGWDRTLWTSWRDYAATMVEEIVQYWPRLAPRPSAMKSPTGLFGLNHQPTWFGSLSASCLEDGAGAPVTVVSSPGWRAAGGRPKGRP
jgi:hypothetical protein